MGQGLRVQGLMVKGLEVYGLGVKWVRGLEVQETLEATNTRIDNELQDKNPIDMKSVIRLVQK